MMLRVDFARTCLIVAAIYVGFVGFQLIIESLPTWLIIFERARTAAVVLFVVWCVGERA